MNKDNGYGVCWGTLPDSITPEWWVYDMASHQVYDNMGVEVNLT